MTAVHLSESVELTLTLVEPLPLIGVDPLELTLTVSNVYVPMIAPGPAPRTVSGDDDVRDELFPPTPRRRNPPLPQWARRGS